MSAVRDFPDIPLYSARFPGVQTTPLALNSPHSGRHYPAAFMAQSRLTPHAIRSSEDCYVDELFANCVALGAPILSANFPRAYLDVNREPYELDAKMFDEPMPPFVNSQSLRVGGGLGTIPRIVGNGMEIYRRRLPLSEATGRIETIYRPYHKALRAMLAGTHTNFGHAVLLDCHSMPGSIRLGENGMRPDVIVGDRFGTSAARDLSHAAIHLLQAQGFVVAHNKPYAGGFITEYYGKPALGFHALQIEVNRCLYMDEQNCAKTGDFSAVRIAIDSFLSGFVTFIDENVFRLPLAAE